MKKLTMICTTATLLSACGSDVSFSLPDIPEAPKTIEVTTDFQNDTHGWQGGFSDFPPGSDSDYQFKAEVTTVPTDEQSKGFLLASSNRSDDVFMYLKRKVNNLKSGVSYAVTGEIKFVSNAGIGCFGIGGSPGESVYVKVGASEIEPEQVDYYMNIDIGSQSQSGNDAVVIGNAGAEGANCGGSEEQSYGSKSIQFGTENPFHFIAPDNGSAWLLIGTDSGYEGYTEIYYTDISITLTPDTE